MKSSGQCDPFGNLYCYQHCAVMTMAKQGRLIRNHETQGVTKENRKIWLSTRILLVSGEASPHPMIVHLFHPIAPPHPTAPPPLAKTGFPKMFRPASSSECPALSPREKEVLVLLSRCQAAKEIALTLEISTETARTHIQHILQKLHAHTKLEALMLAAQYGFL